MPKIRVLVVDDAVVIRKILTDQISSEPELEVAGTAANGKIALQKITQVNPDIITLDVEMPEMDGLETLRNIRLTHPHIPVIMFSTLTDSSADVTMEALSLGASDYVSKPANVGSITNAREVIKSDLIEKIKVLAKRAAGFADNKSPSGIQPVPPVALKQNFDFGKQQRPMNSVEALTIAVSTGGPNALAAIIPKLPADLGVPVFIVQHMPPMFTRLLAERLDAQSQLKVVEAAEGMTVTAGTVYIAPGNFHLEIVRTKKGVVTQLNQKPQENSCRPAADVLFRSVVDVYRSATLGLVLTGMGQDGLRGCELIKEVGGQVIAQDKSSSVVWGMPGYVVEAGLADSILALETIPDELIKLIKKPKPIVSVPCPDFTGSKSL